ncbi:MAG: UPF0182 family protein [Elainellaceae cyanobacterium]
MKSLRSAIAIAVPALILLLIFSGTLVHILTESWWFDTIGFADVFWTRISWQIGVWVAVFALYALVLWANYRIAMGVTRDRPFQLPQSLQSDQVDIRQIAGLIPYLAVFFVLVIAFLAAADGVSAWETILKFFNATAFGQADPIYEQDIGFYIFRLPLYETVVGWLMALLVWSLILTLLIYALKGAITTQYGWRYLLRGRAKLHVSLLLVAIAILVAVDFWLQRYELLYSTDGVVFGAGFTDTHAQLQAYWFMGFATLALAVLLIASLWRGGFALPLYGIAVYLAALIVAGGIYPWFQQQFIVEPNELDKERPYIANNLEFTRMAYQLESVETEDYPAETSLDQEALLENQSTLRNIRLWDYRPLLSTYRQLQEIRLYYRFEDVDIDRYVLNDNYRQVMLAARELAYAQLPQEAQTWVNERLKYTHGYGVVMSPVNEVTPQGLPRLFIQDIPPESPEIDLDVTEPAIYYGELTDNYVFTNTSTPEFDFPQGDENATTFYEGEGGVSIGSFGRRLAYAYDLGSLRILISNYFTPDSRILYHRDVRQRAQRIAPFLQFDTDPYITVIDGRLKWFIDAYTVSDRYPYSEPVARTSGAAAVLNNLDVRAVADGDINYIRNSVKVVVDAFDGSVQFYTVDNTDPLLATYRKIFPSLFIDQASTPANIDDHFRYPLDFFKIQAQVYLAYHMDNPEVFYNREDLWRFPTEIYEGNEQLMEPYYVILRLPEGDREEFALILPFTPVNKNNMIAWMTARSDDEDYGKLLLYEFPKQELVYGPRQIEARIDQNPDISQQLTLWSQEGSRVIRGDLLVIPIEESLLYVEPVYLRAEQGELPELRRVIAAYGDEVAMEETLDQALADIFDIPLPQEAPPGAAVGEALAPLTGELRVLAQELVTTYEQAQTALQNGDWAAYGDYQQEIESLIQQLNQAAQEEGAIAP